MTKKYDTIIFRDDFNFTQNWRLDRDFETSMEIYNSALKFNNHSEERSNLIKMKSNILPNRPSKDYMIETKIKICDSLENNQWVGMIIGSSSFRSYYKFKFNRHSWIEISRNKNKNIIASEYTVLFDKRTDIIINQEYNTLRITNDSANELISFYLNEKCLFKTLNKNIDLAKIGFECSFAGSMVIDNLVLKI